MRTPKTHCKHGHEYTPENTYVHKTKGSRVCRRCRANEAFRERARNREYERRLVPTKTERALELKAQGVPMAMIAQRIGVQRGTVYALIHQAMKRKKRQGVQS